MATIASRLWVVLFSCALAACGPPRDEPDASTSSDVDASSEVDAASDDAAPPDGGLVPLRDDGGPLRLVFLAPAAGQELTCADDADGRLGLFGPIHVVIQVQNDPRHSVTSIVCQSSGGLSSRADVEDRAGARIARLEHWTGFEDGEVTVGLRCEAHGPNGPTPGVPTTDRSIVETIRVCTMRGVGQTCGGC